MWILLGVLACHHGAATEITTPPKAIAPEGMSEWAVPSFSKIEGLGEGPVAFHPMASVLAQGRGAALRLRDGDGAWQTVSVPSTILDLSYGAEGALWVLDGRGLSVFDGAKLRCRNDKIEAEQLLLVDAEGAELMTQSYLDGTGVVAMVSRVDPMCGLASSEGVIPPVTVVTLAQGKRWQAYAAVHTAGPTKTSGPALSWGDESPQAIFSADESWPVSLVVSGERALVVDESGAWELWDSTGPTRVARGKAAASAVALTSAYVAVGRDVVSIASGAVQAGVLPSAVVAVSSDGQTWVLGEGASTALFQAVVQ